MVGTYALLSIVAFTVTGFLLWGALARSGGTRTPRARRFVTAESQRRSFEQALDVELERARRHEHPLTIIRVVVAPSPSGDRPMAVRPVVARRTDLCFDVGSASYLIAPETDVRESVAIRQRIMTALGGAQKFRVSAVTFPDDGISSGSLLGELDRRGHHGRPGQGVTIANRQGAGRRPSRSRPRHRSAS